METRTTERRRRKARSRIEPALFRRNGEHRLKGANMIYSDLTHTEKYIYEIVDKYLTDLSKDEIKNILKVLNNKYLKTERVKGGKAYNGEI